MMQFHKTVIEQWMKRLGMPAKAITPIVLSGLGSRGLNTQAQDSTLGPEWLSSADNVVFDYQGRISSRKGIKQISKPVSASIKSLGSYIKSDRSREYYGGSGSTIVKLDTSVVPANLTTQSFGGSPQTISDSNWQWVNFNNEFWGVQKGHKVINYDGSTWKDMEDLTTHVGSTGYYVNATGTVTLSSGASGSVNGITVNSVQIMSGAVNFDTDLTTTATAITANINAHTSSPNYTATSLGAVITIIAFNAAGANTFAVATTVTTIATSNVNLSGEATLLFDPSCALGDFGRMWYGGVARDSGTLYYSDNLIGEKLNAGAAGVLDLRTVWGTDEIVGLGSLEDKILIFGKQNIVIYSGASNPDTMVLDEVISGVGLAGRDNISYVNADIIFMSYEGLKSLKRVIQTDGKAPIEDLSVTVRNDLARILSTVDVDTLNSTYYAEEGFILTFIPTEKLAYVFDFAGQQGLPRITTFSFITSPLCGLGTIDGNLFLGLTTSVAEYDGYHDVSIAESTSTYANQTVCVAAGNTWESSKCWTFTNANYSYTFQTSWLDLNNPTQAKIVKSGLFTITGGRGATAEVLVYKDYDIGFPYSKTFTLSTTATIFLYGKIVSLFGDAIYASAAGPKEYKVPLGRTGRVIRLKMNLEVNGNYSSLVNTTLLTKQGKIR